MSKTRKVQKLPRGWTQELEIAGGIGRAGGTTQFAALLSIDVARPKAFGWYGSIEAIHVGQG